MLLVRLWNKDIYIYITPHSHLRGMFVHKRKFKSIGFNSKRAHAYIIIVEHPKKCKFINTDNTGRLSMKDDIDLVNCSFLLVYLLKT